MKTNKATKRLVVESALRNLEIESIKFDTSYQREVSQTAVEKIKKDFNPKALGIPVVAEREDGSLWGVDGRQRLTALSEMTDKNRKWVRCEVFASRGPEHEAEIFKIINGNRTRMRPEQLFHASLTAGDEKCWKLKKILDEFGFKVPTHGRGKTPSWTNESYSKFVRTVNFFLRILDRSEKNYNGESAVRFILEVLTKAWPDDPAKQKSEIVEGLFSFRANREGEVDMDRLIPRLNHTTPAKLMYSAGLGVGSRGQNVAAEIEKIYRKRKA